jgi:hydroxypyruvate isomerase
MDVIEALRATGATTNVKLLADLYHLAVNGDEVSNVISAYADEIGHVQIADAPGRNEPGTGELPILRWFDELERVGYAGLFGLEYRPSVSSADCFEWISVAR